MAARVEWRRVTVEGIVMVLSILLGAHSLIAQSPRTKSIPTSTSPTMTSISLGSRGVKIMTYASNPADVDQGCRSIHPAVSPPGMRPCGRVTWRLPSSWMWPISR